MKKPKRILASLLAMLLVIGSNNLSHFIANAEDETVDGQVTEGELIDNDSETVVEVTPTPSSTEEELATEQPEATVSAEMTEELVETTDPATVSMETIEEPIVEETSIPIVEPEILEYTTETNYYQIRAVVESGSFNEKVQLQAIEIATNSEEYSNAVESVAKEKNTNKEEFENQYQMAALDIHFVNESGVEVEPNENKKVSVSIDFKNVREALGEDIDTNTMEIHHISDDENAEVVANNNEIEVDETTNTATTTFEVTQFSVFTVSWERMFSTTNISVKYVDESLNEIDTSNAGGETLSSGDTYTFPTNVAITGYTYQGTYVGSYTASNKINSITVTRSWGEWYYETDTKVSVNSDSTFYMVYKSNTQDESGNPTPGGTVTDVDQLTKHKTVESLGNDQYKLSLDVMGSQGTEENPTLIDILFIVDNSGSMKYSMSSETATSSPNRRIDKVNEAINTLVTTINANQKIDAHYAAVKFAGEDRNDAAYNDASVISYYTSDSASLMKSLKNLSPDGGTNYQAGIRTAKSVLTSTSARANAKKIVIFLSDGVPTFRYDSNGYTIGDGSRFQQANLDNAKNEVANLAAHAFYTIGVADGYDSYKGHLQGLCDAAKNVTGEKISYSGKKLDDLKNAFANITSSIINYAVSDVTVTDTLSGNAEFAKKVDGKPIFHITVKDTSGKVIAEGDNQVTVEGKTIVANNNGGTFQMDFEDDYVLNPDYIYTISTTIQPTTSAYEYYRENGSYPNTGDLGTGTNSSEKDGFYSNDGATVTYTYRDNVKTEEYLKPVIQVSTIDIDGTKTWVDDNNHEGLRPESITVSLFNGETDTGLSVTSTDPNWKYQFERIRKYQDGEEITSYAVKEDEVANYTTTINGYNITNTRKVEKISVSGTKTWDDAEDQDGKRPTQIIVHLLANGVDTGKTAVANETTNWTYKFYDVDKYANGTEITYTVSENDVTDYQATYVGMNITNTHTPSKINISGTKTWDDANNQDGKRPESITVNLLADGKQIGTKTVTANDNWAYEFKDLDEYKAGNKIKYTISEEIVTGYITKVEGYNITNTHTIETTTISGTKIWNDTNNQDGKRPSQIEVKLFADGTLIGTKAVTANDNWEYKFTNLPVYKEGKQGVKVVYKIEEAVVDGYTTSISGNTITNTHNVEKISVTGTKTWNDANDQDGKRPTSITVNLLADGVETGKTATISERDGWAYSFTQLDKYSNGKVIKYTVTEDEVEGYTTKIDGFDITNTHKPSKINISGTKTWDDANNQDGKRPTQIEVKLFADGKLIGTKTVTAEDNWKYEFINLNEYSSGKKINYTISENTIEGYTATIDGYNIKNSYTPETTFVSGIKTWNDNNDQDGIRPESITVNLLADGKQIGTKTVTANDNWKYEFTNLPVYQNGKEITYTISEDTVTGYTTQITGNNITNKHTPETISFGGIKKWEDQNNQDGIRPDSITVKLLADDVETGKTAIASASNGWTYAFENVDKYQNGKEIKYTIQEVPVEGYTTSIVSNTITNTHEVEKTSVTGTKTWNDAEDQDGIRPESITVKLLADDVETGKSATISERNGWAYTFTQLDKYSDGKEIKYTVTEDTVEGYATKIDGFDITNTHKPAEVSVTGNKTWIDDEDRDGIRPESITVKLLADDSDTGKTAIVSERNNWTYTFENLPEFNAGKKITYTVKEVDVPEGYEATVSGNNITNTHEIATVEVKGTKTWDDANNQDGIRPESIEVQLYADGNPVEGKTFVTTSDLGWKYEFTNLPKNSANGQAITYTVEEVEVPKGYEASVNGYDITNTHKTYTIDISGTKTWIDAENQDGKRPTSITVRLLANDEEVASKEVTADTNWEYKFEKVAQYANGQRITYTVVEDEVTDYTTEINGFDITNTHEVEKTSVSGTKTWNDADNQDGKRPSYIIVRLLANGEEVALQEVTEANDWTYTFDNLDKYSNGNEIVYSVTEDVVDGYTTEINGFDITNTHEVEKTSVSGTKTWNDADNQDGKRPTSITVNLYGNGEYITSKTVSANQDGSWTYTFDNLDKYSEGNEIVYTVTEEAVEGYSTEINGFDITNTHEVEKTSVSGTKTWNDVDNQDGKRPGYIIVRLLANGEEVALQEVTEANDWTYTFDNLDKYSNGNEIQYVVREDAVENYSTSYNGNDIVNAYTPEETSITIDKTWNDNNDQDGIRPDSIVVRLLADGEEVRQVTISSDNQWTTTIENLPVYKEGQQITYTVVEDEVDGYTTEINNFSIINTHETSTIDISGTKTWDDAENQDGKRPGYVVVRLLANGEEVASQEVTEANNWTYTFEGVDQFAQGEEIEYTVIEDEVLEYESIITGFDITNVHKPNQITISGTKTWNDNEDELGLRPLTIIVNLYADGELITSKEVSAETNWTYEFTELDEYKSSEKVTYTITEDPVSEYVTTIDGYNLINTVRPHTPETKYEKVSINKVDQNGDPVIGAELELKDAQGNVVDHWTTDGTTHEFDQVEVNKEYVLHEVSAPSGYDLAEDVKFMVAEGEENKVITMVDQKQEKPTPPSRPKTPTTGDHNNIIFYGMMSLSSLLVAFIALLKKRREVE